MIRVCSSTFQITIPAILLYFFLPLMSWCEAEARLTFINPAEKSSNANEGHLMLSWGTFDEALKGAKSTFQLQQDEVEEFSSAKTIYQGTDDSTFISGLTGGTYFFRVRSVSEKGEPGPWSDSIEINVNYVSPKLVLSLLLVGVVVLVATVSAILRGHNQLALK